MHYDEFVPEFEKQYPEFPWKSVQVSAGRAGGAGLASWTSGRWGGGGLCLLWMVLLFPPGLVRETVWAETPSSPLAWVGCCEGSLEAAWRGIQDTLGTA